MTFVLPNIVEVLMSKISLWINIRANDWTAKSAIISSDGDDTKNKTSYFQQKRGEIFKFSH